MASLADVLDVAVVNGPPSASLANIYHSYGHEVYCYANPQPVPEFPETFRYNYGLLLWQNNYDGAMDYSYQSGFKDIWNDFDIWGGARDLVYAYPTANGVIDTLKWEGYREGVDDVRYLTSLLDAIGKARKSDIGERRSRAMSADAYLKELKDADLRRRSLDTVRLELARHILDLQRAPE